ncbi:MAG: tRNA pseudouridine(55) synthase TruB [Planctomycetes bacterium]|nr:tRNA pseudouridine(55) synthase TruB [Planctomycetota bacterium]MBI3835929.1 tRNA pseudouridine(55) synthase TruB [Planctomycetota bacterium]
MDGIINLNKPVSITSAKALYRVRSITGQKKSGHAGTLDPAASGVLVLCMGKATKLVESIMEQPKVYRATARLDVTSESFDSDRTLRECAIESIPNREQVELAIAEIERSVEQMPPNVSALKIGGVPAYKMNSSDAAAALAARPVKIHWIRLHAYDWPTIDLEVCCGRGTYVRAIIRDLGTLLSVGGCLTSLVRTCVGPFVLEAAWTFERLASAQQSEYVIPLDKARESLDVISIPPSPETMNQTALS